MHRALWEFRIRGVVTNLRFLDQLITHPQFAQGDYTTKFIDTTPELFAGRGNGIAPRGYSSTSVRLSSTGTWRRTIGCGRCNLTCPGFPRWRSVLSPGPG